MANDTDEETWDRIAGCLHGLLVGDALGCPVEMWAPQQIRERFDVLRDLTEVPGPQWRPKGLHSDDGQQALAVADAICLDPEHPERTFAELLITLRDAAPQRVGRWGLHRGVGRNFRQTVRGLQATGARDPLAHATPSAGNGAAMRIAPVGLWWRDQPDVRDRRAAALAAVTHSDLRGISAAQAVAIVVADAFADRGPPRRILTTTLIQAVEQASERARTLLQLEDDPRFLRLLTNLVEHRQQSSDLSVLLEGIRERAVASGGIERDVEATSGFAPCSVLTSLAIVDLSRSFEEALITAVNLGGDTDTIGAMVGAMVGARQGVGAIPVRWLDGLCATGSLVERIELLQYREPREPWPALVDLERNWDQRFELRPSPARKR